MPSTLTKDPSEDVDPKIDYDEEPLDLEGQDPLELFKVAWKYKVRASSKKQKNNVKFESALKKSIIELDIRVPVHHSKNNTYVFGHQKV